MHMRRAGHSDALFLEASTRALERRLLAALPPRTLMRRAGLQVAQLGRALAPAGRRAWVLAGSGHNGGDGMEAAMRLSEWGFDVTLSLLGEVQRLPPDAEAAWREAKGMGLRLAHLGQAPELQPQDLIVDALLGLGCSRAPQGLLAEGIAAILNSPARVLAIDLPSGLDGNTGRVWGPAVRAHHTLSLLTLKPGCFTAQGKDHAGQVWFSDLGSDVSTVEPADARLIGPEMFPPFTRRARARHSAHKGTSGDVWVIGGREGMSGAAALATSAALAAGAGRVWWSPSDGSSPAGMALRPEVMVAECVWQQSQTGAQRTVVMGCGAGALEEAVWMPVLKHADRLVLDADGLNALSASALAWQALQQRPPGSTVLTPHPLEAARLLDCTVQDVQCDRLSAARALASQAQATVILKGSGTIVCTPGLAGLDINLTGHDALASPGTGDVLAGWLGGWWAGLASSQPETEPPRTHALACATVCLHGTAAQARAQWPLRAQDLIESMLALSQTPSPGGLHAGLRV
jgi:hydroxyethylthiazole kinase-like uncharacterized protein yjeF